MDRRRRNIKREKERKVERVKVKIQNILKVLQARNIFV